MLNKSAESALHEPQKCDRSCSLTSKTFLKHYPHIWQIVQIARLKELFN